MFGNIPPFFTQPGAAGVTGSPSSGWTFNKAAQAGVAETIATFKVSDDATGKFEILNNTTADGVFRPMIAGTAITTATALAIRSNITTDTGANAALNLHFQTVGGAAVTIRPLVELTNLGNSVLSVLPLNSGANSALSWGTQAGAAPAFTTRSAGTRLVLFNNIGASTVDYAIGYENSHVTFSCEAALAARGFKFYGGTTLALAIQGNGLLTTTGGKVKKVRIALTSPVTIAVTDDIVIVDLTTPGAVTINYPASPEAGREYIVIDGKGDSGANNHTHTPAAGTINGAATAVVAANYYRRTAVYDGSKWLLG